MNRGDGLSARLDFQRSEVASLSTEARNKRLVEMQALLVERMTAKTDQDEYFDESTKVINELKNLGYDLWSWGYDGDAKEIWGWDYVTEKNVGELVVEFRFPAEVVVRWGDNETRIEPYAVSS